MEGSWTLIEQDDKDPLVLVKSGHLDANQPDSTGFTLVQQALLFDASDDVVQTLLDSTNELAKSGMKSDPKSWLPPNSLKASDPDQYFEPFYEEESEDDDACFQSCESGDEFSTPLCTPDVSFVKDNKPFRAEGVAPIPVDLTNTRPIPIRTNKKAGSENDPKASPSEKAASPGNVSGLEPAKKDLQWLGNLSGHINDPQAMSVVQKMEDRCIDWQKKYEEVNEERSYAVKCIKEIQDELMLVKSMLMNNSVILDRGAMMGVDLQNSILISSSGTPSIYPNLGSSYIGMPPMAGASGPFVPPPFGGPLPSFGVPAPGGPPPPSGGPPLPSGGPPPPSGGPPPPPGGPPPPSGGPPPPSGGPPPPSGGPLPGGRRGVAPKKELSPEEQAKKYYEDSKKELTMIMSTSDLNTPAAQKKVVDLWLTKFKDRPEKLFEIVTNYPNVLKRCCKTKITVVYNQIAEWEKGLFSELDPLVAKKWRNQKWMEISDTKKEDIGEKIKQVKNAIAKEIKAEEDKKKLAEETEKKQDMLGEMQAMFEKRRAAMEEEELADLEDDDSDDELEDW
eukprot:TRINITY_DN14112_c0_g1_i1.p1 TRINITY_DN14112_c0_g1~~TRINITY_DN14112_c0_g1_i1.p1  ORF type:complete len:602 (+),score=138.44 TRINITY_DN14112_c0_g1_i1:121-1806(+)